MKQKGHILVSPYDLDCLKGKVNPRDGEYWEDSKRYKRYTWIMKHFGFMISQRMLNFYNRINPY